MSRLVHFPWLHPALGQEPLPEDLVFLDPGVDLPGTAPRWRPEDLPLNVQEVRRTVREYFQFAERFPKVSDMSTYQATGLDNFYTDTTMDIMSQLTGDRPQTEPSEQDRRQQAQLVLALALFREEQFVDIGDQEGRFASAKARFADVLGLDDEEAFAELGIPDEEIFSRASADLPWKNVLVPMMTLLPEECVLFVSDADVVRELEACGLSFAECSHADQAMRCCRLDAEAVGRICGPAAEPTGSLTLMTRPSNL